MSAMALGFEPLIEFPDIDTAYDGGYLFSVFSQRIPAPGRQDRPRLMAQWGVVNPDDSMEILAKSGGVQLTDRIELCEHRAVDDCLDEPLEFRVAGGRHLAAIPLEVVVGQEVILRREPENPADPDAVRVEDGSGQKLGYVPRQYAKIMSAALAAGTRFHATVVRTFSEPGTDVVRPVVVAAKVAAL